MSTNPVWNAFTNDTKQTQSLQIDSKEPNSNQDSTLMLSLSNYLQYDDPSIFYHEKYPENHQNQNAQQQQNLIIRKSHPFIQEYCIQQQFESDQNSESMLLLESGIKPNNREEMDEFGAFMQKKLIQGRKSSYQNEHEIQKKQFLATKNQQTLIYHDKRFFTQSLELLELLSIPKQKVLKQSYGQKYLKEDELKKVKMILEYFQQNKELINHPKLFWEKQGKNVLVCDKCNFFEKRMISLEQLLASKQKQIRKYQELIDQLNSKAFDLKIQNKRLTFENQQYMSQIQGLLSQNSKIKSKQRLSIISYENSENQDIFDEQNNEISSNTSRALSKKSLMKQDAKPKQQQKLNDSSDKLLKGSIFKFKESQFIQIAERTIDQMLKNNKKQNKTQNESSIKRFSDILYQNKNIKLGTSDEALVSGDLMKKQPKSPLKKADFFKEKGKQIIFKDYKNTYPLNKISQVEKGCQNNHDLLNKLGFCQGNLALKQKAVENSFQVYKSFKEINALHIENSQNNKAPNEPARNNNQSPYKTPYNFHHIERNSSPQFSMKKQNTDRQRLYSSPIAKQNKNIRQTQTKQLFR